MATMGLRINNGSGIDLSNADLLAKAIFGDPDQAMRLKRLESDLATADLQRGQIASHTAYNQALKARQDLELAGMKAGVAPLAKLGFDRQQQLLGTGGAATGGGGGGGGGGAVYDLPVPVEVNVPIPAVRPIDSILGPQQLVRPDIQPLDSMPAPVQLGPEPDFNFPTTYELQSDLGLPETGPVPARRPGDMPLFQPNPLLNGPPTNVFDAPIAPMPDLLTGVPPSLTPEGQASVPMAPSIGGVPPELTQERQMGGLPMPPALEGVPPALTQERQIDRSVNVPMPPQLSGLPQEYGPEGSRYTQGPPGSNFKRALEKMQAASSPEDQGFIADLMDTLGLGAEVQPAAVSPDIGASLELPTPTPWTQPSGPPLPDVGAGLELPGPQQQPAFIGTTQPDLGGSLSLNENDPLRSGQVGGPDVGAGLDYTAQPPVPVDTSFPPVQGLDLPVDPTAGIPYPGDPRLDRVPPELRPVRQGETTASIPGRERTMPAPDVADMPVPVGEPYRAEGQPYQGPNVPQPEAPAQPEIADPHLNVQPVHPKDVETVATEVQRQTGGQLKGFTYEDYEGLAKLAIAGGGDVAGTFQKLMGTAGLTYGDFSDPASGDKLRQTMALAMGQTPTQTSVAGINDTSGATVAANAEIAKEAAKPPDLKKNITESGEGAQEFYMDPATKRITARNVPGYKADPAKAKDKYVEAGGTLFIPNADGSLTVAPGQEDTSGHIKGESAEVSYINTLIDLNKILDEGKTLTPSQVRAYEAADRGLNGPVTSVSVLAGGEQQALTNFKPPIGTTFRKPDQLDKPRPPASTQPATGGAGGSVTTVPPDLASPAAAGAGQPAAPASQAEQIASERPKAGGDSTVKVISGPNAGKDMPIKNMGGWTSAGEQTPMKVDEVPSPGGGKVVSTRFGEKSGGSITDSSSDAFRFMNQSIPAAAQLDAVLPGDEPTKFQRAIEEFRQNGITEAYIANPLLDEDTRAFARAMYTYINGEVRPDSGATVKPEEWVKYESRFVMPSGGTPKDYVQIKANRVQALRATRMGQIGQLPADQLKEIDRQATKFGVDWDYNWQTDPRYQEYLKLHPDKKGGGGGKPTGKTYIIDDDGKRQPYGGQ